MALVKAQRLGRVLRLKADRRSAHFYTLVSLRTCEENSLAIDNFFWQNRATAIS